MSASTYFRCEPAWIIITFLWISCCDSFQKENLRRNEDQHKCMSALVSRTLLSDEQFSASSYLENKDIFQPKMARFLDINSQSSPSDGRAWCPATPVHNKLTEWLEIDFSRLTFISGLYTMGRGDGNFNKFTPEIVIKYQRSDSGPWITYMDSKNESIIAINTDSRTQLRLTIRTIVVKKIRIYPLDSRSGPRFVCLKIAFQGCYFNDEVISYTAPQGDVGMIKNHLINLRDESYDGTISNSLQHGLGLLMDNAIYSGGDFISNDMNTLFTGWRCTKDRANTPIIITFYYNEKRVFSEMSLYYVTDHSNNVMLTTPITVIIGYNNSTHRSLYNNTVFDLNSFATSSLVSIPLGLQTGTICILNITCGNGNWIILHEVEIKSAKSITTANIDKGQTVTTPYYQGMPSKGPIIYYKKSTPAEPGWSSEVSWFLTIIGVVIILLLVLFGCVVFIFYKMKKLRKDKLNKKLELVAKCNEHNMRDPSGRTVFTIQSRNPSLSSIARPKYYSECKQTANNTYTGSQISDGVYASWPNTDEEIDIANVDKEEEKCLLGNDTVDNKSANKDYAVYQPGGVNFSGSDYFQGSGRPSSILLSGSNMSDYSNNVPLSVAQLKIVSAYDIPKSTPIVTYRNCNNVISLQHFLNYRGICGDVDLRYQSTLVRPDLHGLDPRIQIVTTTSIIFVQPWVRGKYGCIDLVTVMLNKNDSGRYFMKKLSPDTSNNIKSKFVVDLQMLSSLNSPNIARLAGIVVEGDLLPSTIADVTKSAKFCLLMEHNVGYNLKDFLRNIYYPNQTTQNYTITTLSSQSQISILSMLLIITQISNGLRHLEELGLTHRDVGCRNCIIDSRRQIKLYPGGYVTTQPFEDYCTIELQSNLINFPLRWLAPESIAKGVYTTKSDVWSFGVTMWEVFTLCSLMPYTSLTNEALLELMTDRDTCPRLPCPQNCAREIFDLMTQCWCWDESLRPSFIDINIFLQIKTTTPVNQAQLILPAPPPPPFV